MPNGPKFFCITCSISVTLKWPLTIFACKLAQGLQFCACLKWKVSLFEANVLHRVLAIKPSQSHSDITQGWISWFVNTDLLIFGGYLFWSILSFHFQTALIFLLIWQVLLNFVYWNHFVLVIKIWNEIDSLQQTLKNNNYNK